MRPIYTIAIFAAATAVFAVACNNSHKLSKRIKATVFPFVDSTKKIEEPVDTVKIFDSIQIEFGNRFSVPYDSINNIQLYNYVKEHVGKKCTNNSDYSCETFLPKLLKNVYSFEFPSLPLLQMRHKNLELFKDTSYLKQGDLLFFNYSLKQPEEITHTGFYLRNGHFLVSTYNSGIIITEITHSYWKKHFVAAGRITKLTSTD